MSYVDAIYDRQNDVIKVAERVNGVRVLHDFPPQHVFYFTHPSGSHKSIFGDPLRKAKFKSSKLFYGALKKITEGEIPKGKKRPRIFESDINPVFRFLADNYRDVEAPVMNLGFFDIETDWSPVRGYAPPSDPFMPITAISLQTSVDGRLFCLALKPPTYSVEEAEAICSQFEDTILFTDEKELLKTFLELIEDVDVLSGWNSEQFDIPYLVNRVSRLLGSEYTRKFCLWGMEPRLREFVSKIGKDVASYDLVGRVHLDYLLLYQKHNPQQQQSYKLDSIGEVEVGEKKVDYDGSLDDLYKKDFQKFVQYSRQDTALLGKIDAKLRFIELANQIAHSNGVILKTTMGSVALVEQAIINEMHAMGGIVPNRKPKPDPKELLRRQKEIAANDQYDYSVKNDDDDDDDDDDDADYQTIMRMLSDGKQPVAGAYVAKPKTGMHRFVACIDINSLYPSCIRALNMSPETLFGQVRQTETQAFIAARAAKLPKAKKAEAWENVFCVLEVDHMHARDDTVMDVDFSDGTTCQMTGAQLHDFIFDPENHLCISANGTIFRTDVEGMVPRLLAKWYRERQEMQAKAKSFFKQAKAANDPATIADLNEQGRYWDQRQQARKILLNSLYGALLNEGLRFYDERIGQSVTLTGRMIARHMNARTNKSIAGEYDYTGSAIVYADTDSCYFSAEPIFRDGCASEWFDGSRESYIEFYDAVSDEVNESFPGFMAATFNTGLERGAIIAAGRELVASSALFIKKKKYAVLMYDKEGTRYDVDGSPGKLKIMGLDLKRSDTPRFMQKFLQDILLDVLQDGTLPAAIPKIRAFRTAFKSRPAWEKGSPKKVTDMTKYEDMLKEYAAGKSKSKISKSGKVTQRPPMVPAHVRGAINWNMLCDAHNDNISPRLSNGTRIVVCKLRSNVMKLESISFPVDIQHLPKWFNDLPFDHAAMEEVIIDKKLSNLLSVMNWNLSETRHIIEDELKFG